MFSQFVRDRIVWLRSTFLKTDVLGLFFIALSIRLFLFGISLGQGGMRNIIEASPDSVLYLNMAQSILEGTDNYEHGFFIFGPGYAYFLAIAKSLMFGSHILTILFQILLASVVPVFVFYFSKRLTESYTISIVAGYLFAVSWTAISLSQMFLSESVFLFVFSASLIVYLRALDTHRQIIFAGAGILVGVATLIRPIGQFWFVPLIFIALVTYWPQCSQISWRGKLKLMKGPAIAAITIIVIVLSWSIRNYSIHGVMTLSQASAGGPFNVAALAMEDKLGKSYREIQADWFSEYHQQLQTDRLTTQQRYAYSRKKTKEIIMSYSFEYAEALLATVWENMNRPNYLPRSIFPDYKGRMMYLDNKIREYKLQYINFFICLTGFLALLVKRKYWAFWVLFTLYTYYAVLVGFTKYQGSRLFMPGQLAAVILISITIWSIFGWIHSFSKWLHRQATRLQRSSE